MANRELLYTLAKIAVHRKLAETSAGDVAMGGAAAGAGYAGAQAAAGSNWLPQGIGWLGKNLIKRPFNAITGGIGSLGRGMMTAGRGAMGLAGRAAGAIGEGAWLPPVAAAATGAAIGDAFAGTETGQAVARGGNKMMGSIPGVGDVWKGLGSAWSSHAPIWAGGSAGTPAKLTPFANAQMRTGNMPITYGGPTENQVLGKSSPQPVQQQALSPDEFKQHMARFLPQKAEAPEAATPAAPKPVQRQTQVPMRSTWQSPKDLWR